MKIADFNGNSIFGAPDAARIFHQLLAAADESDVEKEHVWMISLNIKCEVKSTELIALGTLTGAQIHPREAFRQAIIHNAAKVIFAHNHPSGHIEPSAEDLAITTRLQKAGEILDIPVVDHIIIGNGTEGFTSLKEKGVL